MGSPPNRGNALAVVFHKIVLLMRQSIIRINSGQPANEAAAMQLQTKNYLEL
jgi:hypothetical protein